MIEIIKAAFFAGEIKTFLIQGEYVEILEAAYPVDVAMMDRSGAQLSTMRNAEASYFSRPGKYEVIQVTSTVAQTVRLFVGSGDAGTRRTSGDVSVIDGEKSRTMAGGMFSGAPNAQAVAANYSVVQLWNPPGSGKNLIVTRVDLVGASTAQIALIYTIAAMALTDQTAGRSANKKSGEAMGVGQVRSDTSLSQPVFAGNLLRAVSAMANDTKPWEIKGAVIVSPGRGLSVIGTTIQAQIIANFDWMEEAI